MCLFLNGGSLNKVLGPKTPQQQGIVLRPAENVSFFSVLFFYCELHMVDMCECVCQLFPVKDIHYSNIYLHFLLLLPLG